MKYSIRSVADSQLLADLSVSVALQPSAEYSVTAATYTDAATLSFSSSSTSDTLSDPKTDEQEWGGYPVTPFAEQPETDIGIGGASDALFNTSDPDLNYFMGCISYVAIDSLELPLNGLLTAAMEGQGGSGFQVEDMDSVDSYCNLCDIKICPESSVCVADGIGGGVVCDCEGSLVLAGDGRSCLPVLTTEGLNTGSTQPAVVSYVAGGACAAVVLLLGVCVILVIVGVRRRQERNKKATYNINSPLSTQSSLRSKHSNSYTPTIPKRRPSLTSATHAHCSEAQDRSSSISTYQEHDPEPEEFSSPAHHASKRMRHLSVESGIKMDTDHEASIGMGIPEMDDSGHEVNSTDSARSEVSEDIVSSCFNEQLSRSGRQTISLRIVANSDQYPHSPLTPHTPLTPLTQRTLLSPHTPLTPKEQKIMIPIRPASTNLSQSEFGDEVTDIDTESFHTRVSSSSGVGGSMQNQGRGSDSENSKSGSSTPQWYKSSTTSDTERENERIQVTRAYYPMHHPERGTARNYQPRFKPSPAHLHPHPPGHAHPHPPGPAHQHPPGYFSPPSLSHHMMNNGNFESRPRSKSFHSSSVKPPGPLAKTVPQRYENYPHMFTSEPLRNGRPGYTKQHVPERYDSTPPRHERQLSDPRALDDGEYTPTSFTRQYSDPRIPHNGNYCIPRKHHDNDLQPVHSRQMSDPRQSSQQTQDSIMVQPGSSRSLRHIPSPSTYASTRPPPKPRPYYTLGGRAVPDHLHYRANQHRFSHDDSPHSDEPFQTLSSLSKIDPISKWDAQARMKIAVDHMDPCHLLSGPYMQFEDVSTDPSVVESQLTIDDSIMGEHQVFDSQGGREGTAVMLDPLDMRLVRLREDEIDSILTDSEFGQREMNHFPSADCSSQYTATIVAGSTSTSGESTPKMQKVFVIPPSQQSFDV